MSGPGTSEQEPSVQGDSPPGRRDEDAGEGTQSSHRMLGFSDALLSIIATVMILPVTHTEISPEQVMGTHGLVLASLGRQGGQQRAWPTLPPAQWARVEEGWFWACARRRFPVLEGNSGPSTWWLRAGALTRQGRTWPAGFLQEVERKGLSLPASLACLNQQAPGG